MKIPSADQGHFRWRGMAYNPEGRRSTVFQCDRCNDVIKEYDDEIIATLELHDKRKHGKQTQASAAPAA